MITGTIAQSIPATAQPTFWEVGFSQRSHPSSLPVASVPFELRSRGERRRSPAGQKYGFSDLELKSLATRRSASYAAAPTHSSVRGGTFTMAAAPCKPAAPLAPARRRTSHGCACSHRRRPNAAAAARAAQLAVPRRRRASRARRAGRETPTDDELTRSPRRRPFRYSGSIFRRGGSSEPLYSPTKCRSSTRTWWKEPSTKY